MPAPANPVKRAFAEGRVTHGCWLGMTDPLAAEIAATAGFDWLVIDAEHAVHDVRSVAAQLAVAGPGAVVRLRDHDPGAIKQLLDAGAQTLIAPMVESAAEARALVAAMRYPPAGRRGVGAHVARASRWGLVADYAATAEAELCLLAQIESRRGLAAIREILAEPGVDGLFLGPVDLAADMGFAGEGAGRAEVAAAVLEAIAVIVAAGGRAGVYAVDPAFAARCRAAGASFLAVGHDLALYASGLRALAAAQRGG